MSRALVSMCLSGRAWAVTSVVGLVTSAMLLAACTGGRTAEPPPTTTPVTSPTPIAPTTAPVTPPQPVHVEFEFRQPDPVCPPVSAIETLPLADQRPYELVRSSSYSDTTVERSGYFDALCSYQRTEIGEGGEDMILEDHARIGAQMHLYRRWEDSPHANRESSYHALPVQSADLDDWRVAMGVQRERVRWEGCGAETPCEEGEEPTVRTLALHVDFTGHVGNLEFFDVTVSYIAQRFPSDVERRTVEIFRDFVLAAMESYERAE